ncbi:hypothetical protein QVD17_15245 [Tagetes erecta]|uniref:DNA topoisomerase n=1 Tax=Tagetes erecta TaxID=13708 RepID=A0AAD8KNX7_TARER|nr:hypothetical protein QVD17_15245 [Tagetes erecta]
MNYSSGEDDEPLVFRRNIKHGKLKCSSQPPKSSIDSDSEYEDTPLRYKISSVSNMGSSNKVHQNGSAPSAIQYRNIDVDKRPLDEEIYSDQSPVKKTKLLDSLTPVNHKPVTLKAETKLDDDNSDSDFHISRKIKKQASSSSKPSSSKQKVVNKNSPSLNQANNNSKTVVKKSRYSRRSDVPPGFGEVKWNSLIHNGVIFPPAYKPHGVKMLYKGKPVDLTPEQEEVATLFAVMLDTDYMTKPKFKENFWDDWRKILGKNHSIQNLDDCDFKPIYEWHQIEKEKMKQMSEKKRKALKEEKMKLEEKYMWAIVDGVKEKVINFRVTPPGLFRGRGDHSKTGKLKKRIRPSDITINIGKDAPIPECPIPGESWKEIRHDCTVTWLANWNDPINTNKFKYVALASSSSLKDLNDKEKYEKAEMLKGYIQDIRKAYTKDFGSKDVTKRQIAVATYLIDKVVLSAGNEKDDDDEADTVGCCTLKVKNVEPSPPNILKFDFVGKDTIRNQIEVEVELPVFKAIQQFRTGKKGGDDLFDKLDTSKWNAYLQELMPGLTAEVFRTCYASITLDDMGVVIKEPKTDLACAKKGKPPSNNSDGKPKRNLDPEFAPSHERAHSWSQLIESGDSLPPSPLHGTSNERMEKIYARLNFFGQEVRNVKDELRNFHKEVVAMLWSMKRKLKRGFSSFAWSSGDDNDEE